MKGFKICVFGILSVFLSCNSQKIDDTTHKKNNGSLIFEISEKVSDELLLESRLKLMDSILEKNQSSVYKELKALNINPVFDPRLHMLKSLSSHIVIKDSIIYTFKGKINKSNNTYETYKHLKYNLNENRYSTLIPHDTLTSYGKKEDIIYKEESDIVEILEFKRDRKVISGFNCFKIKVKIQNKISDEDVELKPIFDLFPYTYYDMYVTKGIKIPIHPHMQYRSILNKYYPLEITEYSDVTKGFEKNIKIRQMSLSTID